MPGGHSEHEKVATTLRRNQNELGVWTQADHPNLVPRLATIDKGGLKSLIMPFYKDGDLETFLHSLKRKEKLNSLERNDKVRYHLVRVICTSIFKWNELIAPSSFQLIGAAEGLKYLHDTKETAHGDLYMVLATATARVSYLPYHLA